MQAESERYFGEAVYLTKAPVHRTIVDNPLENADEHEEMHPMVEDDMTEIKYGRNGE